MACDPLFNHLMQELFPSYYVETLDLGPYNNVDYKPKGPLTKNLMCMFPKVIAVLENLIMETWSLYLHRTRELMISSPEMYVSHIMLISYVEDQIVDNIFDKFLMVLTSVTHLAERINIATGINFYELTPRILTVYFEKALREDFSKCGGWKHLERHILSKKYNEIYDECVSLHFAISEELQQKMREIVSPPRPYFEISIPSYENIKHPIIVDLTCQVIPSRKISLFNELSLFTLYEKQPDSIQASEMDPIQASEMDPIQASEMDAIQASEMDAIQASEMDGSDSSFRDGSDSSFRDGCDSSFRRWIRFRDGCDSSFRDGSDSSFRDGSDSSFREGST
ncbi:uncharacterized protein TNCV_1792431 [Trichonephila clavipes]|nr:uncharacterized protein TNCV_1792431 [Trichonephila clavipes]